MVRNRDTLVVLHCRRVHEPEGVVSVPTLSRLESCEFELDRLTACTHMNLGPSSP
jgi:hypothetical protein